MIELETAITKILDHAQPLKPKSVWLSQMLGFVLAEDIIAREPIPLFASSAMDGFAVRAEDTAKASSQKPAQLKLQGMIQAGDTPQLALKKNCAIKIFTGAAIPSNADAVIMKEKIVERQGVVSVSDKVPRGNHIRKRGEEFRQNTTVFRSHTVVTPPVIGMLATLGYARARIFRKPAVAIIVTGNELRPPSAKLLPGKIRDSNSYTIEAALHAMGITDTEIFRVRDDKAAIRRAFNAALQSCQLVISIGGVSVGDYDFVRVVLRKLKVKSIFEKIAMKPGKPNFFGVKGKKLVFGLPGNPVSALISFEMLVKPAIRKIIGCRDYKSLSTKAVLASDLNKKTPRLELVRVKLSHDQHGIPVATPTSGQGSHMLGGVAEAHGIVYFPRQESHLSAGSEVTVQILNWGYF